MNSFETFEHHAKRTDDACINTNLSNFHHNLLFYKGMDDLKKLLSSHKKLKTKITTNLNLIEIQKDALGLLQHKNLSFLLETSLT